MIRKRYAPVLLVVCCLVAGLFSCAFLAADIKGRFYQAENCAQTLEQDADKKKYRSYWLNCINQFMDVHDYDPDGPWASAGLYRAGVLYQGLHKYSRKAADHQAALNIFQKVIAGYPKSAYSDKARERLAEMAGETEEKVQAVNPQAAEAAGAGYSAAEARYQKFRNNPARKKYRNYWLDCINAFHEVYRADPDGPWAAAGLYMAGTLYGELYRYSYKPSDREEGQRLLQQLIQKFPQSPYKEKASARLREAGDSGVITAAVAPPVETGGETRPASSPPPAAEPSSSNGMVLVKDLRYWSTPSYTRVVVDATGPAEFTHNLLRGDPESGKPPRLYIDLQNSRLHRELSRQLKVDDNLLKDIRAGQFTNTSVRVVVDIKSFRSYTRFSLRDPFRVVIDVSGQEESEAPPVESVDRHPPLPAETGTTTLAQQLGLAVRRIVIDPGHGGKDGGAPGNAKGVHEKKVVLDLSRMLAEKIRGELGCEVILTRGADNFLTLEERTAIANMKNADLFISIHTNACQSKDAYGIETYILNLATDEDAMRVAAMENSTSQKNISDLQTILQDLMQNAKINESSRLAGYVQSSLCGHLGKRYSGIKNKGVKQAPFYVLIGAQMPSILIETGFISNREECRRLTDPEYQRHVCDGIIQGVKAYIDHTASAGFAPPSDEPPVSGLIEQGPDRPAS